MLNYAYDFLNESILFDQKLFKKKYHGIPDTRLEQELIRYREYCVNILPKIRNSFRTNKDTLSCIMTGNMSDITHLKQAALYLEEAIVPDPIFQLTDFRSSPTEAMLSFMGIESSPKIDRVKLTEAIIKIIELRPLVTGGYVKLYPVSFELEQEEKIPLFYSDINFENCLPPDILEKYRLNADVRSVQNDNGRMLVMRDLYPCRNISIHFKGMETGFTMGYMLNPAVFEPTDKKNEFSIIQKKSSLPPSKEDFEIWVSQSINQTAKNHFINLNKRMALCDYLDSMFITEHQFESNLLKMNLGSADIKSNTLNCMFQMDIPFLEKVSSTDLMSIRNDNGESFQSFRLELEKGLRTARYESDPNRVRAIIDDTKHELFEVQMSQIEPQIKYLKKTHLADASIAIAGLGLSVVTGGFSLLATGMALAHGYKSYNDYQSKVTANPSHFLWQVRQKMKA